MKAYCNCKTLTGDKNETKYKETTLENRITCSHCGYYAVWAKNDVELYKLVAPKKEDNS